MSHDVFNIVAVYGVDRSSLQTFVKKNKKRGAWLDGTKISKQWKKPLIDELRFEWIEDARNRSSDEEAIAHRPSLLAYELPEFQPLSCACYAFYSGGFGGGTTEYFVDASLRHPILRFVVQWLYADWGEIGIHELQAGEILSEEIYDVKECGEQFFRKTAAEYYGVEFSQTWFEEV